MFSKSNYNYPLIPSDKLNIISSVIYIYMENIIVISRKQAIITPYFKPDIDI